MVSEKGPMAMLENRPSPQKVFDYARIHEKWLGKCCVDESLSL